MWSAWGYCEAIRSPKDTGSMPASKLQEGEVPEYVGFHPAQPLQSR